MSLQYDKKKFNTLRDQFYTNPTINPISGKKIQINKVTYNQLVKEFGIPNVLKSFEFFEQLPEDLQTDIYSRNALKRSPTISKTANKVTKNKLCELNITKKEFLNYIHEFIPLTAYAIPYVTKSKYNITKFLLMIYPSVNTELKYIYNAQLIKKDDMNIVTIRQIEEIFNTVNFDYMSESEYDLLTSYFIYKRRKSCQHIPNYAKNQILKLLKLNQNKNKNTYIDELKWYMYLRTNLSQFPYELPKNEYYDYVITVDDKENIMDDTKFIMLQLQEDNNQLYQALLDQINKL